MILNKNKEFNMRRLVRHINLIFISLITLSVLVSCGKDEHEGPKTSKEAQQSFDKGNAYYKLGRTDDAIKAYENTVLYDRTHKMAHYNLAVLYKQKERYAEAVHEFEEYLKYETDDDEGTHEVKDYVKKEIGKLKGKL